MISVRPLDRTAPAVTARTEPVGAAVSPQFAALVLDHEGRYEVEVSVDGPLGPASVKAEIEATYELRPSPISALVYVVPFLLAGALWLKILVHRRAVSGV